MRRVLCLFFACILAACAAAEPLSPPTRVAAVADPPGSEPELHEPRPVAFIQDDYAAAVAQAKAQGALVFVDVWAPWCHTCLSMQHEVLERPELAAFEGRVVFAALDSDREAAAAFLARYRVTVWPSFYLIDPNSGAVRGHRGGSLTLTEMVNLIDEALKGDPSEGDRVLQAAHARYAERAQKDGVDRTPQREAADGYEKAASLLGQPRRSEALIGVVRARYEAQEYEKCAEFGAKNSAEVQGSSLPGDFLYYARACAKKLPDAKRKAFDAQLLVHYERLLGELPVASVDDLADLLANAAEALREAGRPDDAKRQNERRLKLLEEAAAQAKTPSEAQVHDYARLGAYVALGRFEEAIALFERRTGELPDSYEAHARLASARISAGKPAEALPAIERAIELSYGPRRLRYLGQRTSLHEQLGQLPKALASAQQELDGWRTLPEGQRDPAREKAASERVVALSKRAR